MCFARRRNMQDLQVCNHVGENLEIYVWHADKLVNGLLVQALGHERTHQTAVYHGVACNSNL